MIIKLDTFEGPFYLLLSLIEKERLAITEVSLVKVADQYVNYLKTAGQIDPEQIADFLVVAAKLLLLKSRALLPYLYNEPDEEIDDFERQIKMYQEFLAATKTMAALIGRRQPMFAREFNRRSLLAGQSGLAVPTNLQLDEWPAILEEVWRRREAPAPLDQTSVVDSVSLEEKISHLRALLNKDLNFSFSQVVKLAKNRTEIIVGFLAILELWKQREVVIEQTEMFGEIEVSRLSAESPITNFK